MKFIVSSLKLLKAVQSLSGVINSNNTLPLGMDVKQTVIFDMNKYKIDLKKQKIFRINGSDDNYEFKEKLICVYEYEAK